MKSVQDQVNSYLIISKPNYEGLKDYINSLEINDKKEAVYDLVNSKTLFGHEELTPFILNIAAENLWNDVVNKILDFMVKGTNAKELYLHDKLIKSVRNGYVNAVSSILEYKKNKIALNTLNFNNLIEDAADNDKLINCILNFMAPQDINQNLSRYIQKAVKSKHINALNEMLQFAKNKEIPNESLSLARALEQALENKQFEIIDLLFSYIENNKAPIEAKEFNEMMLNIVYLYADAEDALQTQYLQALERMLIYADKKAIALKLGDDDGLLSKAVGIEQGEIIKLLLKYGKEKEIKYYLAGALNKAVPLKNSEIFYIILDYARVNKISYECLNLGSTIEASIKHRKPKIMFDIIEFAKETGYSFTDVSLNLAFETAYSENWSDIVKSLWHYIEDKDFKFKNTLLLENYLKSEIERENIEIVNELLKYAKKASQKLHLTEALEIASSKGNIEVVRILLAYAKKENYSNFFLNPSVVLKIAQKNEHKEIAKILAEYQKPVEITPGIEKKSVETIPQEPQENNNKPKKEDADLAKMKKPEKELKIQEDNFFFKNIEIPFFGALIGGANSLTTTKLWQGLEHITRPFSSRLSVTIELIGSKIGLSAGAVAGIAKSSAPFILLVASGKFLYSLTSRITAGENILESFGNALYEFSKSVAEGGVSILCATAAVSVIGTTGAAATIIAGGAAIGGAAATAFVADNVKEAFGPFSEKVISTETKGRYI